MLFLQERASLLRRVGVILSAPPAKSWIKRPEPHGPIIAQFVLPNEICKPTNTTRGAADWSQGAVKKRVLDAMLLQVGRMRAFPLPGRPQIIAIRFSSSKPDPYADWGKVPVDMTRMWRDKRVKHPLTGKTVVRKIRGLGFIAEDSGEHIELSQHWEPARQGQGFTYIEIRTGQ
jgi:hypothetical protein